jgi:tetratricopeptide (TPR) repeat protein
MESMREKKIATRWRGLDASILVCLGLIGAIAGCGGVATRSAFTQETEELFTPPVAASCVPSGRGPSSIPFSETGTQRGGEKALPDPARTGIRLVKEGEYAKAIALLEPHRAHGDFAALYALGVAYLRTERNMEAYEVLLQAHRLNPSTPGPLLPAALACARVAKRCDDYRRLAIQYKALGGRFTKLADKVANHQPLTLILPRRF